MLSKEQIQIRAKVLNILKSMLPFDKLEFQIHCNRNTQQLKYIDLYMRSECIRIKKGMKTENIFDKDNKIRICLKDIYKEFEEEIQELFNLEL